MHQWSIRQPALRRWLWIAHTMLYCWIIGVVPYPSPIDTHMTHLTTEEAEALEHERVVTYRRQILELIR